MIFSHGLQHLWMSSERASLLGNQRNSQHEEQGQLCDVNDGFGGDQGL